MDRGYELYARSHTGAVTVHLHPFASDADALDGARRLAAERNFSEVEVRRGGVVLFTVTHGAGTRRG